MRRGSGGGQARCLVAFVIEDAVQRAKQVPGGQQRVVAHLAADQEVGHGRRQRPVRLSDARGGRGDGAGQGLVNEQLEVGPLDELGPHRPLHVLCLLPLNRHAPEEPVGEHLRREMEVVRAKRAETRGKKKKWM
jgi:hypothetical protein